MGAITGAIIGGIIGGVYGFIAVQAKKKGPLNKKQKMIMASIAIISFSLLQFLTVHFKLEQKISSLLDPHYETKMKLKVALDELLNDPLYQSKVEDMDTHEVKALTFQLSSKGLTRLSEEDLAEHTRLKLQMAKNDPALCAQMWLGGATEDSIMNAYQKFSDDDFNTFANLIKKASILELKSKDVRRTPSSSEYQQSLINLTSSISSEKERTTFVSNINSTAGLTPKEACWTFKKLLSSALAMPEKDRGTILRALASITSGVPLK